MDEVLVLIVYRQRRKQRNIQGRDALVLLFLYSLSCGLRSFIQICDAMKNERETDVLKAYIM